MGVSMEKKTDVSRAYRFFLKVPGANVHLITDVVERGDGTVWIVSPITGTRKAGMDYDTTVACITAIESANGSLGKSGEIHNSTSSVVV